MKSVTSLKHVPFAILLAYGMTHFGLAQAALVSGACLTIETDLGAVSTYPVQIN